MFTAVNVAFALTVLALAIIGLIVRRVTTTFTRVVTEPNNLLIRKRTQFYARLEQRIRQEANADPGNPFPSSLLDMIAQHHQEMADAHQETSERVVQTAFGTKPQTAAKK